MTTLLKLKNCIKWEIGNLDLLTEGTQVSICKETDRGLVHNLKLSRIIL